MLSNPFDLGKTRLLGINLPWFVRASGFWLALLGILAIVGSPLLLEQYTIATLQKDLQNSAIRFAGNLEKKMEAQKRGFSRAILASVEPQRDFDKLGNSLISSSAEVLAVYLLDQNGQIVQATLRPSRDTASDRERITQWQSLNRIAIAHALELQEAAFTPLYRAEDDAFVHLIIPTGVEASLAYVVSLDAKQWLANLPNDSETPMQVSMVPFNASSKDDYNRYYINTNAWEGIWTLKFESKDPLFAFIRVLQPVFFALTWLIAGLAFLYWRNFRLRQKAESELQTKSQILEKQHRLSLLGEMSAQLAHEINQPLTSIANYAVAGKLQLQNAGTTAALLPLFDDILGQSQRAAQVLVTVRALLQPIPLEMRTIDVKNAIMKLEPSLRFLCAPHGVALQVSHSDAMPAKLNTILFEQVLFNLVKNSVQSLAESDRPDKRITLSSALVDGRVLIEHADNGPGIRPENVGKIFESFFTTKADGLGIGLSLCRSVLERFNGRLTLKSNSHLGVCFLIDIPAEPALSALAA